MTQQTTRRLPVSRSEGTRALAYNLIDNKVYCANYGSDDVTVVDGGGDSVITTVGVGDRPSTLIYNPENDKVYCAIPNRQIAVIDRVWIDDSPARGDANRDGVIDIADVVYLVDYLYRNGSAPNPLEVGDSNCDGRVNVGDVIYLINYLFRDGPPPC